MAAKLNLDNATICKSSRFHFIDNNKKLISFLYNNDLYLLHSGKELLAKIFLFFYDINNF